MSFSIIQKSQLEGANRLDAEYYQPEYLAFSKMIRSSEHYFLKDIAFITDGEHGSPDWDEKTNIKYITADNIKPNFISEDNFQHISVNQDKRNERSRLIKEDVLIYSVGFYAGFAARMEEHLLPANIPRSVALIRLKNRSISSEYLTFFLNCKFGMFQSVRLSAGNAQPMLALDQIQRIEIQQYLLRNKMNW